LWILTVGSNPLNPRNKASSSKPPIILVKVDFCHKPLPIQKPSRHEGGGVSRMVWCGDVMKMDGLGARMVCSEDGKYRRIEFSGTLLWDLR
jgi:hypothetical protein